MGTEQSEGYAEWLRRNPSERRSAVSFQTWLAAELVGVEYLFSWVYYVTGIDAIFNGAAKLGGVLGTAEFILAETTNARPCWRNFISHRVPNQLPFEIPATLNAIKAEVPSAWLAPRRFGRFTITEELGRALEMFRARKNQKLDDASFNELILLRYCLIAADDTVASIALPKLCRRPLEELTSYLWRIAFLGKGAADHI